MRGQRTLPRRRQRARGAAMVEFAIVGPVITLLGLALIQYGLMFFAKNQVNHAAFMAARAGSMGHARLADVGAAYAKALMPLYGGGSDSASLAASLNRAEASVARDARIELLNPTKESFADWSDPDLTRRYGQRAIANAGQSFKDPNRVGTASGQNIQDANLIKLRITHGLAPAVPLVGRIYSLWLKWLDPHTDDFHTRLVDRGMVPLVTHVTLQMQSDPVEDANASAPGPGNGGHPTASGDPAVMTGEPPRCSTIGCTVTPVDATQDPVPAEPGPGPSPPDPRCAQAQFAALRALTSGGSRA